MCPSQKNQEPDQRRSRVRQAGQARFFCLAPAAAGLFDHAVTRVLLGFGLCKAQAARAAF